MKKPIKKSTDNIHDHLQIPRLSNPQRSRGAGTAKNMKTIKQCFTTILSGDKEKSHRAARDVRKQLYSSKSRDTFDDIKKQVNTAPQKYQAITEDWRQENFVMAISVIYYLHDREKDPDFLFPWLFQLLQHQKGTIRYVAVRMISTELGPLTAHIRHPGQPSGNFEKLKQERANSILLSLLIGLYQLMDSVWKPSYKKYKYISSLPSGPYKSIQMVLAYLEDDCGKQFMTGLRKKFDI